MTTNLLGRVEVVPLLCAVAGCHCSVLWWGRIAWWAEGRVPANFGGVDVVPPQGAIVVCYGGGRGG